MAAAVAVLFWFFSETCKVVVWILSFHRGIYCWCLKAEKSSKLRKVCVVLIAESQPSQPCFVYQGFYWWLGRNGSMPCRPVGCAHRLALLSFAFSRRWRRRQHCARSLETQIRWEMCPGPQEGRRVCKAVNPKSIAKRQHKAAVISADLLDLSFVPTSSLY